MTDVDMVRHPPHYDAYSVEVIEVTRHCSFDIGNAIKYMLRHLHKGSSHQDLDKAQWYLDDHVKNFGNSGVLVPDSKAMGRLGILTHEYINQPEAFIEVYEALRCILWNDAAAASVHLENAMANHPVE